jgi:hypothetical protein
MKLLVVLALCAFGFVSSRIPNPNWLDEILPDSSTVEDTVFRGPNKEFQFIYNGQLLTGIPSSSKLHAGTRIQAVVSVVFKTETTAFFKFNHFRFGKLNRHVQNQRSILPFMAFENVPINEDLRSKLEAPVKFTYDRGLLTDVVFDGIEQPWSANIKRGALNLLQVNLQKRGLIESRGEALTYTEETSTPNMDFFRVMERSMEGECETLYTVVSEPSGYSTVPVMNVTATINFENCRKRPSIKYNFRFQDPCPTCDSRFSSEEKFLKSSSIWKYNITGTPDRFLIERSMVESQYVLVPFNEEGNVVVTYVNQTMVLFKSGSIQTRIPELVNPKPSDTHMMYSLDWDIMKEKFFLEGEDDFQQETPFSEIRNKVEFVNSILRKLVSYMGESVEDPAPSYYNRLVKFFRLLKRQELERIWKNFFVDVPEDFTPEEHKKVKSMIVDAMSFAGTKENVFFLIHKIKSRQIPPIKASLAIKSFVNIRTVSKDMIDELLTLAETDSCKSHFFLKQSVYLTVGSMMNALCTPNDDNLATEFKVENSEHYFCPRTLKEKFVQKLNDKLEQCTSWEDKVLFLKTIGNAGLDLSIFKLEKIIKNLDRESAPTFLRIEAVMALRQIKNYMPRKVQKILMPIFMNRYESPELRIVCAFQLFQTMPERPLLDQIAKKLFTEQSRQVTSFVFTYLHTMANSTIPCEKKLSEDMKLALRHARFPKFSVMRKGYSKFLHRSVYSEKNKIGMGFDSVNVFSNTSYFPKVTAFSFSPVLGGFWNRHFATIGLISGGVENIFWKYFGERGFFFEKPLEELLRRSPRSTRTRSPLNELKSMFESLRIRPREYFPNRPKSFFYLRFKNQDFGFLPLSLDSLPEEVTRMLQSGSLDISRITSFLETGCNFEFYKAFLFHEMSHKIPTTIGFPLRFRLTVPTVTSLTGQLKADITPESRQRTNKIRLAFKDLKPSFVSTVFSNVEIWNPIVNSGVSVMAKAKFFYPLTGKIEMDLQKSPKEFLFSLQPPTRPVNIFTFETRPVTYTFFWPDVMRTVVEPEERTIMGEDFNRVSKFDKSYGEYIFGMKFNIRGSLHKTPFNKLSDTPFFPLSGPNKIVLTTEPGYKMPKEFFLKFTSNFFMPLTEEIKPEFREFTTFDDSFETFDLNTLRSYTPRSPSKHQITLEMFTRESVNNRRFFLESFVKCGTHFKFCKFFTRIERTPVPRFETEPFKLCLVGETLLPETPYKFTDLVGKKAVAQFKINWGSSCESDKFIKLNVIGERSQKQVELEKMSTEYKFFTEPTEDLTIKSPLFQYEHLYKFSHLLEYKFNMEFNDVPVSVKEFINNRFRMLKHRYFYQTKVQQIDVRNPANKVTGSLTFDPFNRQYFNLSVKTQHENTCFKDIPIKSPLSVTPINFHRHKSFLSVIDTSDNLSQFTSQATCHVSSRYIKTFDEVKYTVPFTDCWTVLAKDCGSLDDPNFGIFMKKISVDSEMKKVKIVTKFNKFVLVPSSANSFRIETDGEDFEPEEFEPVFNHDHIIARVNKLGELYFFELPETGIKVFFDGYTVNVKMSHLYRNVQCGLCGHFDFESSDEFRLPNNELTDDVRHFFRSYHLVDDSCTLPELNDVCSSPRCEPSTTTPVYCPVCKYVFRELSRESNIKKNDVKRFFDRFCTEFPTVRERCVRFFEPKLNDFFTKFREGKTESEMCKHVGACTSFDFYESSDTFPTSRNLDFQRFESTFPVLRTKVIEQNHQVCFSKEPIPTCLHHSYPRSFKPEKRIVYSCMHRDDPQAEVFFRKAHGSFQVINEIKTFPSSFTQSEVFPETCSSFNN